MNKSLDLELNFWTILYDSAEEFNLDSKAECDQLNLAHKN